MNRKRRRECARRLSKLDADLGALMAASAADGRPWSVHGMTGACRDCTATASLRGQGRGGAVRADIHHDPGCPAAAGTTPWAPVPL